MITVPILIESRVMPLRCSVFGVPPSTIQISLLPSFVFDSMWIHACGLIHSTLVTGPAQLHRSVRVEFGRERMVRSTQGRAQAR